MNPRVMSVSVTCRVSLCCPRCRLGPSSRGRCSSAMLCHTPSHSASFVLIPVAACQAQPQTHRLTTRLSPTPGEPMFTSVRAHLCQILVSPLSCRLTLNQDVQTELQMGKWCMGGWGVRMCCGGWWPLSCRDTLLTKSDHPARAREWSSSGGGSRSSSSSQRL